MQSGKVCSKPGMNTAVQATFDVVIILFALIPLVNILYTVNFSAIKRLRKCVQQSGLDGQKEKARKQTSSTVELSHL